eukprot:TRINITY_DN14134_c0_g1_i1.p2 TRINITY_DN14134_c0_g1~~TRINITY_DN14134_c0_g1_i1.p2  ORF type:complete len:173 (+),score=57.82 TRINITY_DN14134_c0_g1_i1:189-707(+)
MPASAGHVPMPAGNRVATGAALRTHGIWQTTIGDPYAPLGGEDTGADHGNAYDDFKGLLALARLTGNKSKEQEVATCKKCGSNGHLSFQCRNHLSVHGKPELEELSSTSSDESDDESDDEPAQRQERARSPVREKEKKRKREKEKKEKKKKKKKDKSEKKEKKHKKKKKKDH